MTVHGGKPESKGDLVLSASLPQASVVASTGSVAVAGDNVGSILNVNAQNVTIVERQIVRELPSYLSKVVAQFSADLSEYNSGPKRTLPP